MSPSKKKDLSTKERDELLTTLKERFEKNAKRHEGIDWADVEKKLASSPAKLWSLSEMKRTGGEPDVVGQDKKTGEFLFYDCSVQTPEGRRSLCFDRAAWEARKANKPEGTAMDMAAEMGIEMLTEEEYRGLQELGDFDTTTSSWLITPEKIRKLGGALFGDKRYATVFLYHNGADSYYAARGFRGVLRV